MILRRFLQNCAKREKEFLQQVSVISYSDGSTSSHATGDRRQSHHEYKAQEEDY